MLDLMMEQADLNNDGVIDRQEFYIVMKRYRDQSVLKYKC
jgi:hypothetical protein